VVQEYIYCLVVLPVAVWAVAPRAPLVERRSHNPKVASSILAGSNPLIEVPSDNTMRQPQRFVPVTETRSFGRDGAGELQEKVTTGFEKRRILQWGDVRITTCCRYGVDGQHNRL
jgi:hypothetical protein